MTGEAEKQSTPIKKKGGARPGAGRKKGIPNKLSGDVKAMILKALDDAGGAEYLLERAKDNPVAFMTLVGKVLPMQITGEDGGAIQTVNKIIIEAVAASK